MGIFRIATVKKCSELHNVTIILFVVMHFKTTSTFWKGLPMLRRSFCLVLSLTIVILISISSFSAGVDSDRSRLLESNAVTIAKSWPVISEAARVYLANRDGGTVKVWVFFTDKRIESKSAFETSASSINLSEKVLKRRAKVGLDNVVFADLPVPNSYLQSIVDLGAKHRRTSKWQNAASFEIPLDKLTEVAALPFVAEIKPMALAKRAPLPQIDLQKENFAPERHSLDDLNYGNSLAQLVQIGLVNMHNKGFHGEGITLAILDTGFRKSHEAFAAHYLDGRVLAEYDFIFDDGNTANEPIDDPGQWSHGTLIWSVSGGQSEGDIYGPAYEANFLLAKTEDIRSETPVEEDNWVAAVEWADSLGADVLTSSLGYIDWYTYADLNGATAVTTVQANMAASMGILVCNSNGNGGPGTGTLMAPADAHDILAVGAVNGSGVLANFSSRGPTADGRIKPEVCARGVSTWSASSSSDIGYTSASGTSLSAPLVAGAACILTQVRPNFPPEILRQALMETASNAATPNNNYGWGIINVEAASNWGAEFTADTTIGNAPLTVQFSANTSLAASGWSWTFGDGGTSSDENPVYQYLAPGTFDVSLTIQTIYGPVTTTMNDYIALYGDTLKFEADSAFAGEQVVVSVNLINSQELESMIIPFRFGNIPDAVFDSVTRGSRTAYFEDINIAGQDFNNNRFAYHLIADDGGGALPLAAGSGEVMKIYVTIDSLAFGGLSAILDTTSFLNTKLSMYTATTSYIPVLFTGSFSTKPIIRGDTNRDFRINILDLTFLVDRIFRGGPPPITIQAGDMNTDFTINVNDLTFIIDFIFRGGPPPSSP